VNSQCLPNSQIQGKYCLQNNNCEPR
jgi:hypothetical protein